MTKDRAENVFPKCKTTTHKLSCRCLLLLQKNTDTNKSFKTNARVREESNSHVMTEYIVDLCYKTFCTSIFSLNVFTVYVIPQDLNDI